MLRTLAITVTSSVLLLASNTSTHAAGPFSPAGGELGSTAIRSDSALFVAWATEVVNLTRGRQDITNANSALATVGTIADAIGATTSANRGIVSLGDGGSITLGFALAITNGPGADFAVFENAFKSGTGYFSELAHVEVSSDGINFFRFPSVSLTPTTTQIGSFAVIDPTNIYNLAGKDPTGWGTPFNLDDLVSISPFLNVDAVTHVRLMDVVGSIDPLYGTRDSLGNLINDPFRTAFASGGLDFDAIGVINQVPEPSRMLLLMLGATTLIFRRHSKPNQK